MSRCRRMRRGCLSRQSIWLAGVWVVSLLGTFGAHASPTVADQAVVLSQLDYASQLPQALEPTSRLLALGPSLPSLAARRPCLKVVSDLAPMLADLLFYFPGMVSQKKMDAWYAITSASKVTCRNVTQRAQLMARARKLYREGSGSIGVILPHPASQSMPVLLQEFLKGQKMACRALADCTDKNLKVRVRYVSGGSVEGLKEAVAELVLRHKVSLLMGGWDQETGRYLNKIGLAFRTPVFIVRPVHIDVKSPYTFFVYPHEFHLATRLLQAWKARGVSSVAIMQPPHHSRDLIDAVKRLGPRYGVTRTQIFAYNSASYDSMERAGQELFNLHSGAGRSQEWALKLESEKKAAEKAGEDFDEASVFLEPQLKFDMVLIPDNAKVVRHFLKIFQYLRYSGPLPLSGTPLWRSKELVDPWDSMLQGAMFVDFIGRYHQLPAVWRQDLVGGGQAVSTHQSIFMDPRNMAPLDLRLMGYRAMSVALQLRYFHGQNNKQVGASHLSTLYFSDSYFKDPQVFTDQYINWPTFSFFLSGGQVREGV